jgi:hypothetical protein
MKRVFVVVATADVGAKKMCQRWKIEKAVCDLSGNG